jgi:outer membrane protein
MLNRLHRNGLRGAALLGAAAWLSGCVGVPDDAQMRGIRAAAAERRLGDIEQKATTDSAVYLAGPLLLSESVALALGYNRSLQQAVEEVEVARGQVLESYGEALPTLALTGTYLHRDEELGTRTAAGDYVATRLQDQTSAGLRLTQPLFNGRIGAALRAARLYDAWSRAGLRAAAENLVHDVIRAYYDAVLSSHLLDVNLAALATAEAQLEDARARRAQGMASNYDELRAEVEVSNFRAQSLQARNEKDVAYTALYRLMGASPESAAELVEEIPFVPESIGFADALRLALENRADLLEAEYAVRLQRESVALAAGRYVPDISGYATQTWQNPDPHDSSSREWGDEWQAGIQASWPIFDGFARRGMLVQERAKLRQRELALQDAEERVVSQIRQAVLSLTTAEEFAHSQSRNLETAREALRLVQAGQKEGQNSAVEVIDARQALTTASANYYQSLFAHAMARVSLRQAMGLLTGGVRPDEPVLGVVEPAAEAAE